MGFKIEQDDDDDGKRLVFHVEGSGLVLHVWRDTAPDSDDPDTVELRELELLMGDVVEIFRGELVDVEDIDALEYARTQDPVGDA